MKKLLPALISLPPVYARIKSLSASRLAQLATSQTASPACADYLGEYFDTVDPPYGGGYPNPTPLRPCALSPPRLRRAYGLAEAVESGNDGRGVTIAIIDALRSPTLVSDAQTFAAQFDPKHPLRTSQITLVDSPSGGDPPTTYDPSTLSSIYFEQLLDTEWAHGVAPGAHILYVGPPTAGNEDYVAGLNFVVENNLASIVSNSLGLDVETAADSDRSLLDPILIQAGLKGIGLYFASGDSGDNQCGPNCIFNPAPGDGSISVWYPASSPYVTAVGGTSLFLNAIGRPAYETGFETGDSVLSGQGATATWVPGPPGLLLFGAGGGPSQIYSQPKYQRGIVPVTLAGSLPARVIPDVAMLADADSGVYCALTDPLVGSYVVYAGCGGTSLATPLFAATVALAEQRAGHRLGFANPKFYRHALTAFRDITPTQSPQSIASVVGGWTDTEDPPNLQVMRPDGTIVPHTLHSAPGFDNVTGLGVPKGETFLEVISGQ